MAGGEHEPGVPQEELRQLELLIVQAHPLFPAAQHVPVAVQAHVPEGQKRLRASGVPAGESLHPGHELPAGEGLGQIVVRPRLQPGHPILDPPSGGQHQHRNCGAAPPDSGQHLHSVRPGHHDIQHDHVICRALEPLQRLLPVMDHVHGESVLFQQEFQGPGKLHLVLRN